jgi:hypothetical protein
LEVFQEHPNYFKTQSCAQLHGNGFNWESIYFGMSLPYCSSIFTPTPQDAKELIVLYNEVEDLKRDYRDLVREIENALYSLRTFNRIKTEFPEAVPFLPIEGSTSLTVNLSGIRSKLQAI